MRNVLLAITLITALSGTAYAKTSTTISAGSTSEGGSASGAVLFGETSGSTYGTATSGVKASGTSLQTYATNNEGSGAQAKGLAGTINGSVGEGTAGGTIHSFTSPSW